MADHPAVMEVLTAYTRMELSAEKAQQVDGPAPEAAASERPHPRTDIQAALTVISRRNPAADRQRLNLSDAHLRGAVLRRAHLEQAKLCGADLRVANLIQADLRWAKNLMCPQLTAATGWESAFRDPKLACEAEIPAPPPEK